MICYIMLNTQIHRELYIILPIYIYYSKSWVACSWDHRHCASTTVSTLHHIRLSRYCSIKRSQYSLLNYVWMMWSAVAKLTGYLLCVMPLATWCMSTVQLWPVIVRKHSTRMFWKGNGVCVYTLAKLLFTHICMCCQLWPWLLCCGSKDVCL